MIFWEEQESWTVGDIVRRMREEEGLGLEQLSHGLCSAATLSRIESGNREMDLLLAARIFQRLGYKIDQYELYATKEELKQWEHRRHMEELAEGKETEALAQAVEAYQQAWDREIDKNPLQRQFAEYMQGLVEEQQGRLKEAEALLESAISATVPDWKRESGTAAMGELELKILDDLADVCEKLGNEKKSEEIRNMLLRNIGRNEKRVRTYLRLYTGLLCKNAKKMVKARGSGRVLREVEQCLRLMQEEKRICHWPELLHVKAACQEALFSEGRLDKETMLDSWRWTYYIYRLYENWQEAENIRTYVEETYQWDCIISVKSSEEQEKVSE